MADLFEHYETGEDGSSSWMLSTTWDAQMFTPSTSHTVEEVQLYLARYQYNNNDPGLITVSIKATDGGGQPTGVDLCSGTANGSGLPKEPTYSWISFDMGAGTPLISGTKYAIVIRAPFDGGFNLLYWRWDGGGGYPGGSLDVSSDSGSSWTGGYSTDMYFREYGTGGSPTKATNPTPTDSDTDVDFSGFQLSWDDGGGADTFDVYIGETGAVTSVSSAQAGTTYTTTLAELETIFGVSPIDQKIYWRVDATNDEGTTTGDEWNFDARPAKATTPSPTDTDTDTVLGLTLTWTGSDIASSYNTLVDVGDGLEYQETELDSATWTPSPTIFDYITEYTWRVDSTNSFGTTEGDEWTFTTLQFTPPGVTYFYGGYYYRLLIDSDGNYGDHPADGGIEDIDYVVLTYTPNFIRTNRVLVAVAENRFWHEQIT